MAASLRAVVRDVLDSNPDHVLVNGDVAFRSGEAADYVQFRDLIQPIVSRGVPIHLTLGNHDHRGRLLAALAPPHETLIADKAVCSRVERGTHWILLDSLEKVNGIPGTLGPTQRSWLARRLDNHPNTPAVICLHHNPEVSLAGLTDTPEFLEILRPRRQAKAVIFGHTHEFHISTDDGLHFINLPAVGYSFRADKSLGWLLARVSPDRMEISFNCLDGRESACGTPRVLSWRSDNRA